MQKHLVQSSETCVGQLAVVLSQRVQRQTWIVEDHDPPLLFLKHRAQAVGHNSFPCLNPKGIASITILMWAKCRTHIKKKNIPSLHKAPADFQRRNLQTSPFTASPHTSWRTLCTDSHGTVNKARNSVHRVFLDRLNWKRRKLAMCLSRLTTPLPSTAVEKGEDNPQLNAWPTAPVPRCYCQLRLYTDGCFVNSKRNLGQFLITALLPKLPPLSWTDPQSQSANLNLSN